MLELDSRIKVITFDCYGTLVQWHDAVRRAAASILERHLSAHASTDSVASFAARLREIAMEHQQQSPFRDYEAVLDASLNQALRETGHDATAADLETLLATLGRIEPHPDVPEALARLREHYRIAVISNTSDHLIADTITAIGTPIDFVITAQQARAYKPDHALFHHAYAAMGVTKDETIHVAMGQVSDLKVCQELGIRSVWIDREGEPLDPAWQPDAVLKDLSGLPQLLTPS
ncbi:haloacid dehalogenase type II [Pseudomonas graminis]|uniref:(S)-2-haloacid dehalogenase 4A n=1 Tax=Pseudomonas graminis TaxID=158627 RepID=A0A6M8MA12_9PSED|nr:haloacid dehalogenase type II [Pseudomonas graminis]QKF51934.1 (S)-2-haloacid dehalogenase 4A [Pseudomonas graminis]